MTWECERCGERFVPTLTKCPFCGAPAAIQTQPPASAAAAAAPPGTGAVAPAQTQPAAQATSRPRPQHQEPPEDCCPRCFEPAGQDTLQIQTWEWKDTSLLSGETKYLVRTREIPGVCAACSRWVAKHRYLADLLCLLPLVGAAVLGIVLESKAMGVLLLLYLGYLIRRLSYNWADWLLYGTDLESRLERFRPPGDEDTTRFPAGSVHCLVRVGAIPAVFVAFVAFVFATHEVLVQTGLDGSREARAAEESPHKALFAEADEMGVVLAPEMIADLRQLIKEKGPRDTTWKDLRRTYPLRPENRDGKEARCLVAYASREAVPSRVLYQPMTGRQVLLEFVNYPAADLLVVEGPRPAVKLTRDEARKLLASLPAAIPRGLGMKYGL